MGGLNRESRLFSEHFGNCTRATKLNWSGVSEVAGVRNARAGLIAALGRMLFETAHAARALCMQVECVRNFPL